jgi:hypothetical protein
MSGDLCGNRKSMCVRERVDYVRVDHVRVDHGTHWTLLQLVETAL